ISGFQINQNSGSLTPLAGSPFPTGKEPVFFAIATVSSSNPPIVSSVFPNSGAQAQTSNITIIGRSTHFSQSVTTVSFGADVTVNSVNVTSATSLSVNLTIPVIANLGGHTVTVTTGGEVASIANGFTVTAAVNQPPVVSAGPNQTLTLPLAPVAITEY